MPLRLGHITPSSNTVLEPLTEALNAPFAGRVTHHFSRVAVTHLALAESADRQFAPAPMLAAARLLADARPQAIVWNGTAASWRGLAHDLALCRAIEAETGIPATTTTRAFYRVFRHHGFRRIALAVPYTADVTARLAAEYAAQGFTVPHAARLDLADNLAIGATSPDARRALLREAAAPGPDGARPDCIAVVCTNLDAASLAAEMEAELGLPIVDSIAITFLAACRLAGLDAAQPGWGRVMATPLPPEDPA